MSNKQFEQYIQAQQEIGNPEGFDLFNNLCFIGYSHHTILNPSVNGSYLSLVFKGKNGTTNRLIVTLPKQPEQQDCVPIEVVYQYDLDGLTDLECELTKEVKFYQN